MHKYTLQQYVILAVFTLLNGGFTLAQEVGVPELLNFSKTAFNGGALTMEIDELSNGFIVGANNDGLLVYNGVGWECLHQPNGTIMRSLLVINDTVYCGGQNELGYFSFNTGAGVYTSIAGKAQQQRSNLGEVWDLELLGDTLVVRAEFDLFHMSKHGVVYKRDEPGKGLTTATTGQLWHFGPARANNLENNSSFPLPDSTATYVDLIHTVNDDSILISVNRGIHCLNCPETLSDTHETLNQLLLEYGVNSVKKTMEGYAIGTKRGGLLLLSDQLELIKAITTTEGLQRNDVYAIHKDKKGNTWLGTSNGIDVLKTASPFHFFSPDGYLRGAGHASVAYNGDLYFGTNNGVFCVVDPTRNTFELIPGTVGQVWGLRVIDDLLWVCHHEGLFIWDGNSVQHIYTDTGCWDVGQLNTEGTSVLLGKYDGIGLLKKTDFWRYKKDLEGIDESSRILAQESPQTWWVSHPYIGAWRFSYDDANEDISGLDFFNEEDGFPSNLFIYAAAVDDEVLFTAETGLYIHETATNRISPIENISKYFPNQPQFLRLFDGVQEDIWFVTRNQIGFVRISESAFNKAVEAQFIPGLKSRLVNGFESMYFPNSENAYIGVDNGFVRVDLSSLELFLQRKPTAEIHTIVDLSTDSIVYSSLASSDTLIRLNSDQNSLRIKFATSLLGQGENVSISTRLDGFEKEWQMEDGRYARDYTNLPPGEYNFQVRHENPAGKEITQKNFAIRIMPPWYLSTWALVAWAILFCIVAVVLYLMNSQHNERERQALLVEKEQELEEEKTKSSRRINQIENDRLEAEIAHKNKELASATMHLVQKGKVLQGIRDALQQLSVEEHEKAKKEVRRLIKMINSDIKLDDNWEQFEHHFDQVHVDFLTRLRDKHPQLTPNDHKLCAYLRMNLSTKEIATIMNISIRGVEISRYRLRKKLALDTDVNLTDFIMGV